MCHMSTMEFYSTIKNEMFSGKWMELERSSCHVKQAILTKINIACFLSYRGNIWGAAKDIKGVLQ
jgi:hypothetical protein